MNTKDLNCILSHPLFSGTEETQIADALSRTGGRICSFPADSTVLAPDSSREIAGILLEGQLSVFTADEAHPSLLRHMHEGEIFGITNLFSGEPFVSVIRAKTAVRICFFDSAFVRTLMEYDRNFLDRYLAFLAGRIRFLNRKIGYLTAGSAERRLALYLASYGTDRIRLEESLSSLSELLDIGRASLYRAFDRLTADGYLVKSGRTLTLYDRDALLRAYQ